MVSEVATRAIDSARQEADRVAEVYRDLLETVSVVATVIGLLVSGIAGLVTYVGFNRLKKSEQLDRRSEDVLRKAEEAEKTYSNVVADLQSQFRDEDNWAINAMTAQNAILFGEIQSRTGKPDIAREYYDQAEQQLATLLKLEKIPAKVREHAYTSLTGVYKRLGKTDLALSLTKQYLAKNPSDAVRPFLLYNAACYSCLVGDLDNAVQYLSEALRLKPDMKGMATEDADFNSLREDPRFIQLV